MKGDIEIKKVNTSSYHPQTDGLVEKFNSTLIGMVAKVAEQSGKDWDRHPPFLLFAYGVSMPPRRIVPPDTWS